MNTPVNMSDPTFHDELCRVMPCQVMTCEVMICEVMDDLQTAFPRWQSALVRGGLSEFQECTRGLEALARALQEQILRYKLAPTSKSAEMRDLSALAKSLREQARVLLATLHRLRSVLQARSQALAGASQLYAQPAAAQPEAI